MAALKALRGKIPGVRRCCVLPRVPRQTFREPVILLGQKPSPGDRIGKNATGDLRRSEVAEGRLVHLRGWIHEWLPSRVCELVAVIDDASSRVHSGLFVERGAIWSRFRTIRETIAANGLIEAIHADCQAGSHHSPETAQFARAMKSLGITVAPSYPVKARTRINRVFRVLREALPHRLAHAGMQSTQEANEFLPSYWAKFNPFFAVEPKESTTAFQQLLPVYEGQLREILCLHDSLEVAVDKSVRYQGRRLSIPAPAIRSVQCGQKVTVHEYEDRTMSLFSGRQRLGRYDREGRAS